MRAGNQRSGGSLEGLPARRLPDYRVSRAALRSKSRRHPTGRSTADRGSQEQIPGCLVVDLVWWALGNWRYGRRSARSSPPPDHSAGARRFAMRHFQNPGQIAALRRGQRRRRGKPEQLHQTAKPHQTDAAAHGLGPGPRRREGNRRQGAGAQKRAPRLWILQGWPRYSRRKTPALSRL